MNNRIYLYDGSINTLLDLMTRLIYHKIKPFDIKTSDTYTPSLLDDVVTLELDHDFDIHKLNVSKEVLKTIYYVYLSSDTHKELIIYYFLLNAMKYQNKIFTMRNLKCVNSALKIAKYVSNETHKLKGFIRFKEINNHVLYAEISPTNDCLELLSPHFARRLKNEYWIIKDVGRNKYSIYDKKKYYIVTGKFNLKEMNINKEEQKIENLWLIFFNTIGIESRKNKRCQMNFMPKKYWKYIIEMEGAYEKGSNGK